MRYRLRLTAALVAVLAVPIGIALLVHDAPLVDELIIAGIAIPVGVAFAAVLARVLAKPVRDLAETAEAAAGRPDEGRHHDELARLAASVGLLSERLHTRADSAERARAQVQDSVRRLGEVLRSTHDLMKLLSVVLETALVAVNGRAGAVFLFSTRRSELTAKVARHLDPAIAERRLPLGHGLAGWVAQQGRPMLLPATGEEVPVPADPEPVAATALAVPLEGQSQVLGVLAIYGRHGGGSFAADDLDTIASLARQAAVGIDNVLLHQEAQRLSITDGLTSIWNHRYFQMRFSQEFAAANRFGQHVSLLWIDIDDFKVANDEHGHQRGDAILIELASRIQAEIREVDTLARYGGEEFILILPHIDHDGAATAAERIRHVVADTAFGAEGEVEIPITVSIGYATYPDDGTTQETLLNTADKAMYVAKARGKNRVVGAGELHDGPDLAGREPRG